MSEINYNALNSSAFDQKLAKAWLTSLRSGGYEQAQGKLRKSHDGVRSYCCLGVLCDVIDPLSWDNDRYRLTGFGNENYPPDEMVQKVGLTVMQSRDLANLNDADKTFSEIADKAEEFIRLNGFEL